ncbi:MAG: thiolase family protein [Streptosporangiales bacterium]|nr:thiolase family protein [Streptosporangiales bacterium]
MRRVYVVGTGMTLFGKQPARTFKELTAEAVEGALADSGRRTADVQAAYFGNAVAGSITGQEMLPGQFSLFPAGLAGIPMINVENACASASTAFHLAWQGVAAGLYDCVLAVATEKMTHPDKRRSFDAILGSVDVDIIPDDLPPDRSYLMDMYAKAAIAYMETSGATPEDFARVVVKNQRHGALNPYAQYGSELSVEDVLGSREIVWPFTLLMCSPISDGAAAALLVAEDAVDAVDSVDSAAGGGTPVEVLASAVRSADPSAGESARRVTDAAATAAYDVAGIGPDEVDCAEVHDAAASAELTIYEDLGFAARGDGAALIRSDEVVLGGKRPVNTSGGLLARGHPIGATGLAQIVEVVTQVQGRAGDRQVADARIGLAQNAGGWHIRDNVVAAVHLFGRQ